MRKRTVLLFTLPAVTIMMNASAYSQHIQEDAALPAGTELQQRSTAIDAPYLVAAPKTLLTAWGAVSPAPFPLVAPVSAPVAPVPLPVTTIRPVTTTVRPATATPNRTGVKQILPINSKQSSIATVKPAATNKKTKVQPAQKKVESEVVPEKILTGISTRIVNSVSMKKDDGTEEKCAALTFDDGPDPIYTPQILAILKKYGVHATFCVVGRQVKKNPDLVRQIIAEGHKIANHSMNHDEHVAYRSVAKIKQEVLAEVALIESVAPGTSVEYFRAPGGTWNMRVRKLAASWGMKPLGWSVDTKDWQEPGVEAIVSMVKNRLHSGGVILMHDGGGNRSESVAALKQFLPTLQEEGYKFAFPD